MGLFFVEMICVQVFFSAQLSYGIVLTCLGDNLLILKRLIQLNWEVCLVMLARHLKPLPFPISRFIIHSFVLLYNRNSVSMRYSRHCAGCTEDETDMAWPTI